MWRFFYSVIFHLCLPLVLARLWWRGRTEPGYRQNIGERFGTNSRHAHTADGKPNVMWIHAVSVGEVRAAMPLVAQLCEAYPRHKILVTVMTPTGRRTAHELFGPDVGVAYLPYDLTWAVRRLVNRVNPAALIIMETELWPNLIAVARGCRVPCFLVNARLSEKSYRRYMKFAPVRTIASNALKDLSMILAQSSSDQARFRALGASSVAVTGNMKFDLTLDTVAIALGLAWREALNTLSTRDVIVIGSTREGEELMLAAEFINFNLQSQKPLLVIVPRHPSRFDDVYLQLQTLLANKQLSVMRRSQCLSIEAGLDDGNASGSLANVDILLGDSMGEMQAYYAMSDVAIIGGSFQPFGGQNLIEACALGKPVIIGPSTFNFCDAVALAIAANALSQVADSKAAIHAAFGLLADKSRLVAMGENANIFASAHRGATARTMAQLTAKVS